MKTLLLPLVLTLVSACGDVTSPGGGGSDGGPDAGPALDAAVPGTVRVTVLDFLGTREPLADVPVVFFQPDGSVADSVDTDADGVAAAEVLPGGAVMAFTTNEAPLGLFQPQLWVVVGVKPDDDIVLGGHAELGAATDNMTFNLPPFKAVDFTVETPCGESPGVGSNAVPVQFYEACDQSPTAAVGYTFIGEQRYFVIDRDIEIVDEMPADVGSEWNAVPAPEVTLENLADTRFLDLQWDRALVNGRNLPLGLLSVSGEVDSDQLTLAPEKVIEPDHVELQVRVLPEQETLGSQLWRIWLAGEGNDDDLLLDADDYRLPWIGAPVFDVATRVFGWPHAGDGDWDATYIAFEWFTSDGKSTTAVGSVTVVAPPGVHEVIIPPVPEEWEEWLPADIDGIEAETTLFDSDQLDWDQARQLGIDPTRRFEYTDTFSEPAVVRYSSSMADE